ncbi:glycoside hydrolase domain-containing protein [Tuberibacillus sp. Marseille-P3662]|uniref:glycoside hydrolase domain-containing protein n=1 Tax=Tuberibacillus sp. Marseille-P3662 TaxID=1965358 RepID=UPI000A1C96C9|nr:glycoside hydrolase domain-containing protein [Tuberibacillus sp. Marseille-P3662]
MRYFWKRQSLFQKDNHRSSFWWLIMMAIPIFVIGSLLLLALHFDPSSKQPDQPNGSDDESKQKLIWGIDTANQVTDNLYQCVDKHYGQPAIIGRYLGDKDNVSTGLTQDEAQFIHQKGARIIPIHNHFTDATGRSNGIQEAQEALDYAQSLDIPKETYLFADIEPSYPVNADFLMGWTKTLIDAHYQAGVYGNFADDNLRDVYQTASKQSNTVKKNLAIWSNEPKTGVTSKKQAPHHFKAETPNSSETFIWQYGLGAKQCNTDTNLIKNKLSSGLW